MILFRPLFLGVLFKGPINCHAIQQDLGPCSGPLQAHRAQRGKPYEIADTCYKNVWKNYPTSVPPTPEERRMGLLPVAPQTDMTRLAAFELCVQAPVYGIAF